MNLPEFIQQALAHFKKSEAHMNASAELDKAQAKVKELEDSLATANSTVTARDNTIKDLQAQLDKAKGDITAKDTEITNIKAEVETEKKRANETIAKQGLPPDKTPEAQPAATGKSLLEQLEAITEPKAKAEFRAKNFNGLLAEAQKALKSGAR